MEAGEPVLFSHISAHLAELRAAILTEDVDSVELHTAAISSSLSGLQQLLAAEPNRFGDDGRKLLCDDVRHTSSLLSRSVATIRALRAVYQSFAHSEQSCLSGLR
jgi:hypothetical protein